MTSRERTVPTPLVLPRLEGYGTGLAEVTSASSGNRQTRDDDENDTYDKQPRHCDQLCSRVLVPLGSSDVVVAWCLGAEDLQLPSQRLIGHEPAPH